MFIYKFGYKSDAMKNIVLIIIITSMMTSCSTQNNKGRQNLFTANGKSVSVYTTADSTGLRLSLTGTARI